MTLKEYQDFFEAFARRHVAIQHQPDPDPKKAKIRFCVFEPEEINNLSKFKLDMGNFCLALKKFNIRTGYTQSGQARKFYDCGFVVFKTAGSNPTETIISQIQDEAQQICEDIWLEMQWLQQNDEFGKLQIADSAHELEMGTYDSAPIAGLPNTGTGWDVFVSISSFTDYNRRNPARFLPA